MNGVIDGVPGARLVEDAANGPILELENPCASARIALCGAKVLSFIPRGGAEVIGGGTSPDVTSHRGVPVCWPWFGSAAKPSHGFVRNAPWSPVKVETAPGGAHRAVFAIDAARCTDSRAAEFPLRLTLTVECGDVLEIALGMHNHLERPVKIGCALHTYFHISDISGIAVRGLDKVRYVDHTAAGQLAEKRQVGDIRFAGEVDWVFLPSRETAEIVDPGLKRVIRVEKSGSGTTVVWNPGERHAADIPDLAGDGWRHMVCVEAANAFEDVRTIAPGAVHTLAQKISCRPL